MTATTVNGIGVESHIVNVEADTADVLVAENTLLGGPLETSNDAVLDLEKVLHRIRMRTKRKDDDNYNDINMSSAKNLSKVMTQRFAP